MTWACSIKALGYQTPICGLSHQGNRSQITFTGHEPHASQCAGRKGGPAHFWHFHYKQLPYGPPKALFINISTPLRIAYMCCQGSPRPKEEQLLSPTPPLGLSAHGLCPFQTNLMAPLLKTPCFRLLVLFSLWSLGIQGSRLATEITCVILEILK